MRRQKKKKKKKRDASHNYCPAPQILAAFPEAKKAIPKTSRKGAGLRKRWKDKSAIYEWDSQHAALEKYDSRGNHLGEFDPETGEQTKPPRSDRKIEP